VLLVVAVALIALHVELARDWKAFFDAMQGQDASAFRKAIGVFFVTVALLIAAPVAKAWLEQTLAIRWRTHPTRGMLSRRLDDHTSDRIERDNACDDPDPRLTDDIPDPGPSPRRPGWRGRTTRSSRSRSVPACASSTAAGRRGAGRSTR
jgi:putative ATP-binding cassette transporter